MARKPTYVWKRRRRRALVAMNSAISTVFGTDQTESEQAAKHGFTPVLFEAGGTDPLTVAMNLIQSSVLAALALKA